MLTSIDVKFIFDSTRVGLFSYENILQIADVALSSSCLLAVLAMFLAITSRSSYFSNEWNARHFCFYNKNNSTSSSGLLG